MSKTLTVLFAILITFLVLRIIIFRSIERFFQKKVFEAWYFRVLNGSEFKVKGKFE